MNCKDPKCVYSKRYVKCILPNAYIETISECGRNKIKRKDCKYHEIKEELKANACKKYRVRTGQPTPKSSSKSSSPVSPKAKSSSKSSSPVSPKANSLSKSAKDKLEKIRKNILARKITNKFKNFITPFINRVSAKIESRIEYYNKLFIILNQISEQQCLNFLNETNGKKQYTIGDNMEILLSKQIGSDSKYGVIYLSNINIQYKRLYKFAIKIMKLSTDNKKETKITEKLSNLTLNNINPHFAILYKIFTCNNPNSDIKKYPKLINNSKYIMLLSELANGDLKTVIFEPYFHSSFEIIKNTIQQIYISILSFHIHTKKIHKDAHSGNFLYHKIKPGGYIHYKIFGVDIYIKNIGYIWIIWDYSIAIKQTYENSYIDYDRIICAFINNTPKRRYGWIETKDFVYSDEIVKLVEEVNVCIRLLDLEKYLWIDRLLKSPLFSKELVKPPNNEIINFGNPYVLNK